MRANLQLLKEGEPKALKKGGKDWPLPQMSATYVGLPS